jgi:hypothetical protein
LEIMPWKTRSGFYTSFTANPGTNITQVLRKIWKIA